MAALCGGAPPVYIELCQYSLGELIGTKESLDVKFFD